MAEAHPEEAQQWESEEALEAHPENPEVSAHRPATGPVAFPQHQATGLAAVHHQSRLARPSNQEARSPEEVARQSRLARRVAYSRLAYLGIHHQSHLAFHRPNYQSPEVAVEARHQSRLEEVEARPEATKAFQYHPLARPEEAQWELVEVTKAHPESEDPEVVHHPALQIRLTCPEQSGVGAEALARHHRAVYRGIRLAYHRLAASLHHRPRPYREWELLAAWVAGSDVRPESVSWDVDAYGHRLAFHPESMWLWGVAPSFSRLVVRPELSDGGACEAALAYWVACCLVALARQGRVAARPSQFRVSLDDACHGNDGGGAWISGGHEDPRDPNHDDHDNHAFS